MKKKIMSTEKMVLLALLTAIVSVLSVVGIPLGSLATVCLSLVPIVLGGALMGPYAGAWLGLIFSVVTLMTPGVAVFYSYSIFGTIVTVLVKGTAAGYVSGLIYKAFKGVNRYFAVLLSAIAAPVVNTAIYIIGCVLFFFEEVKGSATSEGLGFFAALILLWVGINFVFELALNMILSPAILRIINIRKGEEGK